MAETALYLLDQGYPFLMEKPMGVNAEEVRRVADRAAANNAFVAVPLIQRYHPFTARARSLLADGRFGPVSHIYVRLNRPTSARYVAWDAAWMLDPKEAGGGCLRNLGPHGLDLFLLLTGEEVEVTGAQLSSRALEQPVEDYASVLVRSARGILGTIEVGNTFPRAGTDGEWKIAGRDAILILRDGTLRLTTASGEEGTAGEPGDGAGSPGRAASPARPRARAGHRHTLPRPACASRSSPRPPAPSARRRRSWHGSGRPCPSQRASARSNGRSRSSPCRRTPRPGWTDSRCSGRCPAGRLPCRGRRPAARSPASPRKRARSAASCGGRRRTSSRPTSSRT